MNMTSRDKTLLALLAAIGVLGAFWFFAYKPMSAEKSELSEKIETKQSELDTVETQIAIYTAAQVTYAADYSAVVRLGVAIPENAAVPSLLVQLDSLAGKDVDFTVTDVAKYPETLLAPSLVPTADDALGIPMGDGAAAEMIGQGTSASLDVAPDGGTSVASTEGDKSESSSEGTDVASSDGATAVSEAPSSTPFQPIELRLQFQGNFFKINSVMNDIDDLVQLSGKDQITVSGRLLFVEGFKMKAGRKGFPDVEFNIGALAFSLPDGEGLTGGATPQAPPRGGPESVSANGETPSPTKASAGQ